MPMLPEAPLRLSITTFCPSDSLRLGTIKRAVLSTLPPGGNGATRRIGFTGKAPPVAGACAGTPGATQPRQANTPRTVARLTGVLPAAACMVLGRALQDIIFGMVFKYLILNKFLIR